MTDNITIPIHDLEQKYGTRLNDDFTWSDECSIEGCGCQSDRILEEVEEQLKWQTARLPLPVAVAASLLLCAAVGFGAGVVSMAGSVSDALAVAVEYYGGN